MLRSKELKQVGEKSISSISKQQQLLRPQTQAQSCMRAYKQNPHESLCTMVGALHPDRSKMGTSQTKMLSSESSVHRKQSIAWCPST